MKKSSLKSLTFVLALSMVMTILALPSCRSLDPTIITSATSTASASIHTTDTIIIRDSIFLREYVAGDTVFRDRIQYRDRWRTHIVHDTVLKTDSIVQVIEHPPERFIPPFYKHCTVIFWILIVGIVIYVILRIKSSAFRL